MLFLICTTGANQFAVEARFVVEVLPRVRLMGIQMKHPAITGLLDYHGRQIPAVDLAKVIHPDSEETGRCGRLVVVQPGADSTLETTPSVQHPARFALCVENATELIHRRPDEFILPTSGLTWASDRRVNPVTKVNSVIVEWIDLGSILELDLETTASCDHAT